MQIWLEQVQDEPFNWDETQKIAKETLERPELLDLGPVRWRGQVVYADPGYFLRARLSYEQTLSCNRCLKPMGEHALHEQDLGLMYVGDELLETDPILIEQLQLNIPMKPLCREDCQGLCPVCGADKNTGACSCAESSPDPRWAALAALKS